ncbi:transmembrane protein [Medicago truncatula]|uniref:Transmembrane protein n=1 Tax=Medicago truncatula TaxID=3880 RepID=A0A072VLU3_MEDTR|nr:transmembrane protein [Medicago truncatula]
MANGQDQTLIAKAKPFIAVLFLQVTYVIMNIITKAAMNNGLSNYVFVVYRHATAFIVTSEKMNAIMYLLCIATPLSL